MRFTSALAGFVSACLLASAAFPEIVVWDPRFQVTHMPTDADSTEASVRGLEFQRDGNDGLRTVISINKLNGFYLGLPRKTSNGYSLVVDGDLDWAEAWDERVKFTRDPFPDSTDTVASTDVHMIVDDENYLHVVYEDWGQALSEDLESADPSGNYHFGIAGYKTETAPRWSSNEQSWLIGYVGPDQFCGGSISPNFFLLEDGVSGVANDTLFATHSSRKAPCQDHPGLRPIRMRCLADPDSTWSEPFYMSVAGGSWTFGEGSPLFVDDNGYIHVIARHATGSLRAIVHFWGERVPPGSTMVTQADTLDVMDIGGAPAEDDASPWVDPGVTLLRSTSNFIDVAWNHVENGTSRVLFSRIPIDDPQDFADNSDTLCVSPSGGERYGRARVSHDDAGHVYVTYISGNWREMGSRQFTSASYGDPTQESDWIVGLPVTPDVRTWAGEAWLVARNDSLFTLYGTNDDDDHPDEDGEVWFQLGRVLADSVAAGQKVVWTSGSQVALASDFVVATAGTLLVEPGVTVWAMSNVDNNNRGRYASKVEIINRGGVIQVEGEPQDRVKVRSTEGGAGEWGGFWFDVAAASSGYGFTSYSRIENADIEDATEGIGIMNSGAPSLVGLTFDDITDDRHILIDSTDVYVPWGHWDTVPNPDVFVPGLWDLAGPMNVIVTRGTRLGRDIIVEGDTLDVGKVNIVVQGKLNTSGSDGSRVVFRPDVIPPTSTTGSEWAGITYDWVSAGSEMSFSDVGYAYVPLTLYYQNAVVEDSRIHHFRDRGIWAYGMGSTVGPRLIGNTVFRDTTGTADLDEEVGLEGIVLEQLASGLLDANTISLTGMLNPTGGSGISFVGTSTYCGSNPASPETLRVMGCTVTGPGASADAEDGLWSGLRGTWFCGSNNKKIIVQGNQFTGWNEAAFNFVQSSDIQVNCNNDDTSSNRGGVIFSRTSTASGADVRLKGNLLRTHDDSSPNNQSVILTDDAVNLALGQAIVSTKGKNQFLSIGEDWYVEENDSDAADSLQAQSNYWKRNGIAHTAVVDSVLTYVTRDAGITSDAARVKATNLLAVPPTNVCGIEAGNSQGPGLAIGDEESPRLPTNVHADASRAFLALPSITRLSRVSPSPIRETATIAFDIAAGESRSVMIDVIDVRGRRTITLAEGQLSPGPYQVSWDRSEFGGRKVAAGIYFARFQAGDVQDVRKLVVIR